MKRVVIVGLFLIAFGHMGTAQTKRGEIRMPLAYKAPDLTRSATMDSIVSRAVTAVNSKIEPNKLAITLIDVRDPHRLTIGDYRGNERFYPASVAKLFYLAAIERQLEDKQVTDTPELQRGIRDMITVSSNEAAQYILDVITGTSSGSELPQKEFDAWQHKRNIVNRWFTTLGYQNINANQKMFCEDAYGIEQQSRNYKGQNRNALTTNATARLLAEIVLGRLNTPERTTSMLGLLSRDWTKSSSDTDDQATGFTGRMLKERNIAGARLWSKGGWTSTARHDAAYVETPDGLKFVLVVFTDGRAQDRDIIPTIAGQVWDALRAN